MLKLLKKLHDNDVEMTIEKDICVTDAIRVCFRKWYRETSSYDGYDVLINLEDLETMKIPVEEMVMGQLNRFLNILNKEEIKED